MQPLLTASEMREYDSYAIATQGIPGLLLMENAGRGVADAIEKQYGSAAGKRFIIVCGKGNNGGDGFVVARHLFLRNANCTVLLTSPPSSLKGDAKTNFTILKNLARTVQSSNLLEIIQPASLKKIELLPKADIIIDALFGTGFSGEIKGTLAKLIEWMNSQSATRVSIDIPSGINADDGSLCGTAIRADLTVTMAHKKIGLTVCEGKDYAGSLEVVDIGVPFQLQPLKNHKTYCIESSDVSAVLPRRNRQAHKHSVGKIVVIAGSVGLTGAAAMTAQSAMRAGAGAVVLCVPKSIYPILSKKVTEVMVEPVQETEHGSIALAAFPALQKHILWSDIVVIGPGLSRETETQQLILQLLKETEKPFLIDADGLNALAEQPELLRKSLSNEITITPHTGELSRITQIPGTDIERRRVEIARAYAKKLHVTLVLKGSPTVTATPQGTVFLNTTGNAGMATAGSGDVLTGLIAGLWAQKMQQAEAAWAGVYLHGKAGDYAKEEFGEMGLLATDILNNIPKAILNSELL